MSRNNSFIPLSTREAGVPPVIMIVGTGRSGTTLVEKVLGSFEYAVSVGEASYIWERGLILDNLCSDGVPFRAHPRWGSILSRAFLSPPDPFYHEAIRHRVERSRSMLLHMFGLVRGDAKTYADTWVRIYRAVAEETGATVIVDASKSPTRAWLLRRHGIDTRIVHVIRDLNGVVESWRKPKVDPGSGKFLPRKSAFTVCFYWTLHNVLASKLARSTAYVRIHLDNFLDAPRETAQWIWRGLGLAEPGASPFVSARHFRVKPDLAFSGNPDRFCLGDIEIRGPSPGPSRPVWFRLLENLVLSSLGPDIPRAGRRVERLPEDERQPSAPPT